MHTQLIQGVLLERTGEKWGSWRGNEVNFFIEGRNNFVFYANGASFSMRNSNERKGLCGCVGWGQRMGHSLQVGGLAIAKSNRRKAEQANM